MVDGEIEEGSEV